jgi:hypothetical protein
VKCFYEGPLGQLGRAGCSSRPSRSTTLLGRMSSPFNSLGAGVASASTISSGRTVAIEGGMSLDDKCQSQLAFKVPESWVVPTTISLGWQDATSRLAENSQKGN